MTETGGDPTAGLVKAALRLTLSVRGGEGVHPERLSELQQHLDECGRAWAGHDSIPKAAVDVLVNLQPALLASAERYDRSTRSDVIDAAIALGDDIRRAVASQSDRQGPSPDGGLLELPLLHRLEAIDRFSEGWTTVTGEPAPPLDAWDYLGFRFGVQDAAAFASLVWPTFEVHRGRVYLEGRFDAKSFESFRATPATDLDIQWILNKFESEQHFAAVDQPDRAAAVYFARVLHNTWSAKLRHEFGDAVRVELDESDLASPTLSITQDRPLPSSDDGHRRLVHYRKLIDGEPASWLPRILAEPDTAMADAVLVEAIDALGARLTRAEFDAWAGDIGPSIEHRGIAGARLQEWATFHRLGADPAAIGRLLASSDWLQRKTAGESADRATLAALADGGRTRRVRSTAKARLREIERQDSMLPRPGDEPC